MELIHGLNRPITASQIVLGLQTIVSRNVNITESAVVISVGQINAGVK
jgi:metal-dependent amidase/aminoacylase/carboxypeptidase family protein